MYKPPIIKLFFLGVGSWRLHQFKTTLFNKPSEKSIASDLPQQSTFSYLRERGSRDKRPRSVLFDNDADIDPAQVNAS